MSSKTPKKLVGGLLAGLLALFAAVVVATPAYAAEANSAAALQSALGGQANATLTDSNTVTLATNVNLAETLTISPASEATITLNLGGHSLTTQGITVSGSGTLVINGSGNVYQNGGETSPAATVTVSSGANFELWGGNIVASAVPENPTGTTTSIAINSAGATTLKGGTVSAPAAGRAINVTDGTTTVDGATVTGGGQVPSEKTPNTNSEFGAVKVAKGTLVVKGGSVSVPAANGKGAAILAAGDQCTVDVQGGTVTGTTYGICTNGSIETTSTIKVSGGTVTGDTTGPDGAGIYVPSDSVLSSAGATAPNTVTVSGSANVSGAAGIVSFGSNVNVQGGTVEATSTSPVQVGDNDTYFPPAAVMNGTGISGGYATKAGTIQVTGGSMVAQDGEPAIIASDGNAKADGEMAATTTDSGITVSKGNFSSQIPGAYLGEGLDWEAKAPSGDAPYSYWDTQYNAEGNVPGATVTNISVAEVVSPGFESVADDATEAIVALQAQYGWAADDVMDEDAGAAANTMWAFVQGAPQTNVTVTFFAPDEDGAAVAESATPIFQEVVTTNANGYALSYFSFGSVSLSDRIAASTSLAPGAWTITAKVTNDEAAGINSSLSSTSPSGDGIDAATLDIVELEYALGASCTISGAPANWISGDNSYSVFYNKADAASVALTKLIPTLSGSEFVGWYQDVNAADENADPDWQPAPATLDLTALTTTVAPGFITNPVGTITATFDDESVVVGNSTPATLTVPLNNIEDGEVDVTINGVELEKPPTLSAEDVQQLVIKAIETALNNDPVDPEDEDSETNIEQNVKFQAGETVSSVDGSYTATVVAGTPQLVTSKEGEVSVVTTLTITPTEALKSGEDELGMQVSIPALGASAESAVDTIAISSPMVVNISPTADAGTVTQTVSGSVYTLTAIANEGFTFVNWTNANGQVVSTNPVLNNAEQFFTNTSGTLSGVLTANFSGSAPEPPTPEGDIAVYRLYNTETMEHLLTASPVEKDSLIKGDWILDGYDANPSGIAFYELPATAQGIPVYRVYDPATDTHMYTSSVHEKNTLVSRGWVEDFGGQPMFMTPTTSSYKVYRLYNPSLALNISHLWTASWNEFNTLQNLPAPQKWDPEPNASGVAWYATGLPTGLNG